MGDIMIDLETLGTVITQIGACYFDNQGNIGDKLLLNVNIDSSLKSGLKIEYGNLKWWLERCDKITWLKDTISLTKSLQKLTEFCNIQKSAKVWSHYYDIYILETNCNVLGRRIPFSYRRWRDIRTLVNLSGYKKPKTKGQDPKNHNALQDALYQVKYCSEVMKMLKEKNV